MSESAALTAKRAMLDLGAAGKQAAACAERQGFRICRKDTSGRHPPLSRQSTENGEDVNVPRKLNGSTGDMPSHQDLHKELLLSHKRGRLPEEKPELQRRLERRRLEQDREKELALRPPSDLEQELRRRQQKLRQYEEEEQRRKQGPPNIPEFVRVKENLRHIQTSEDRA